MSDAPDHPSDGFRGRDLLFPRCYAWFVAASALDVVMTAIVLSLGGFEANPVAAIVIDRFGMHGATAYKAALAMLIVVLCEIIGRHDLRRGHMIARLAVAAPAAAAVVGYVLVIRELHGG